MSMRILSNTIKTNYNNEINFLLFGASQRVWPPVVAKRKSRPIASGQGKTTLIQFKNYDKLFYSTYFSV